MDLETIIISKHACVRYAERIIHKEDTVEINRYVTENETKIREDIIKMIQYGTNIYEGVSLNKEHGGKKCQVYLNGTWIVIVSHTDNKVVTLYSIDLGVGREFNLEYISKLMVKLDEAKQHQQDIINECTSNDEIYARLTNDNEAEILNLKTKIKQLEAANESYKAIMNEMYARREVANNEVKSVVATLIGRKIF